MRKTGNIFLMIAAVVVVIVVIAFSPKSYNPVLDGSSTLDFPSTAPLAVSVLTISITGASVGDVVAIGLPDAAVGGVSFYQAWISATNTLSIRFVNMDAVNNINPASAVFKYKIFKN
jgi:hypothetical protein